MEKKIFLYFIGIIELMIFFLFLINFRSNNIIRNSLKYCREELYNNKYENIKIKSNYDRQILAENITLNNIAIEDVNGKFFPIIELMNCPKLIYRFSPHSCTACVDDDLEILNQLSDSIGLDNIIMLSNYEKINELKIIVNQHNIKYGYYNYSKILTIPLENQESESPYFLYYILICIYNLHT